jgi:hypothetical protein
VTSTTALLINVTRLLQEGTIGLGRAGWMVCSCMRGRCQKVVGMGAACGMPGSKLDSCTSDPSLVSLALSQLLESGELHISVSHSLLLLVLVTVQL